MQVELLTYSGDFAGVPGSRGYFLGVGPSFRHIMAVLRPNLLCDSTGFKKPKVSLLIGNYTPTVSNLMNLVWQCPEPTSRNEKARKLNYKVPKWT